MNKITKLDSRGKLNASCRLLIINLLNTFLYFFFYCISSWDYRGKNFIRILLIWRRLITCSGIIVNWAIIPRRSHYHGFLHLYVHICMVWPIDTWLSRTNKNFKKQWPSITVVNNYQRKFSFCNLHILIIH